MTIINPSFEDPEGEWLTLPGGNQQPSGWTLEWAPVGTKMLAPSAGAGDAVHVVNCVPECVHKLNRQLPDNEKLGGKDALILDGNAVYKMFGPDSFRVILKQTIPHADLIHYEIRVPVQVHGHLQEDGVTPWNIDTGAAYWRLIVNGFSLGWKTFNNDFLDRMWFAEFVRLQMFGGPAVIAIEFECHTLGGVSFFIDNIRDTGQPYVPVEPECPKPREGWTHRISVLVREDAPLDVWLDACNWAADPTRKHDVTQSWDHAFYGPGLEEVLILLWMDNPNAFDLDKVISWGNKYYSDSDGIVGSVIDYEPDPPPVDPPPDFTPINYVPTGCKVFWHGVGDDGQTDIQKHVMELGASMATAKGVVDLGWLRLIKEKDPSVKTVGRIIDLPGVNLEWFDCNQDPIRQAQDRMNALFNTIAANPWVDYWEIINEQDFADEIGHWQLCLFYIEAMRIAESWAKKLAIFSYSMGVPEPFEWDFMAGSGIFDWCAAGEHAIALHEYGMWPRDQVSLLTRFRYVYDKHIIGKGLNIPLFITEYGPDAWTFENLSDDNLMEQLIAYDQQLSQNPYVAGAHIFTVGGAVGGWQPMRDRWVRLYQRFEDYVVSVKDRSNG